MRWVSGPTRAWLVARTSPPTTMSRGPCPASSVAAGRLFVTTVRPLQPRRSRAAASTVLPLSR